MSFNENENTIDYSFSETDVLKNAKSHVRYFIEAVIGIVIGLALLGFLLSTLVGTISCIGGCFGCEACIETAACADEMIGECASECGADCSYEEITIENVENANDCVRSEGIDCFGREGCFACDGCGDCENWQGTLYYNVTIKVGNETYQKRIKDTTNYLDIDHSISLEYTEYLGLFDSETGGTKYVDEDGYIVKSLYDNITLYAHYREYNEGQTYIFHLKLETLGLPDEDISLTVGGALAGLPYVDENAKEGYTFKGWYMGDRCVISGNVKEGSIFHLYTFNIDPYNDLRSYTLTPKFEAKKYTITFVAYGYSHNVTMPYGATYQEAFNEYYQDYNAIYQNDSFFGWGLEEDADPKYKVDGTTVITGNAKLYAIIREAVHIYFYYNTGSYYDPEPIDVKLVEGDTNVRFDSFKELEVITKNESANPGYKFMGWYTSASPGTYDQAQSGITNVTSSITKRYYACWEETDYVLTYKATIDGETVTLGTARYYMTSEPYELMTASGADNDPLSTYKGYDFVGWCENEDFSDTAKTQLPAGTYGTKTLYAKFAPHTYTVSAYATEGGKFTGNSVLKKTTIAYGENYSIEVPERTGYELVGFYYDNNGTPVQCTDGEGNSLKPLTLEALGLSSEPTGYAITLTTKWKIQTFTVTFKDKDTGTIYGYAYPEWNKTAEYTDDMPVKAGHDFKGWMYDNGNDFDLATTAIDKDLTVYAKFVIQTYTVVFMSDSQAHIATQVPWGTLLYKLDDDTAYNITPNLPSEKTSERRRTGWSSTEGSTTRLDDDYAIKGNQTGETIYYYAIYQYAETFTFHTKDNQSTFTRSYFIGDVVNFDDQSADGYTFDGWCSNASLTGTPQRANVTLRNSSPREYWAKFTANTYTITYMVNTFGAEYFVWQTTDTTFTIEDVKELKTSAPPRTGYTFAGWKENNTGDVVTQLNKQYGNRTFYAQYTANTYTVTLLDYTDIETTNYTLTGLTSSGVTKTVTYDKTFKFGVPEAKVGFTFQGWSYSKNGECITDNQGNSNSGVYFNTYANDINVYPIYTKNEYPVVWHGQGSKYIETKALHYYTLKESDAPTSTQIAPSGYHLVGWYTNSNLTTEYEFGSDQISGQKDLWAKFEKDKYTVAFEVNGEIKYSVELYYSDLISSALDTAQAYANAYATEKNAKFVAWVDVYGEPFEGSTVPAVKDGHGKTWTLKAIFDMPISVTFKKHTGETYSSTTLYRGDSITYQSYNRTGWTFDGWYTDGSLDASKKVTSWPITLDGKQSTYVFYPKFNPNKYTIYYVINGSTQKSETYSMADTEVAGGFALWTPTTTEVGKVFDGWYSHSMYQGVKTTAIDNSNATDGSVVYGDRYYYGKWKSATYTFVFMSGSTEVDRAENVTYGYSLPTPDTPAASLGGGKSFLGWQLNNVPVYVGDSWADDVTWATLAAAADENYVIKFEAWWL